MIGYVLTAVPVPIVINDLIDDDPAATDQLFRLTRTWSTDRGLTSLPDATSYQYFTRRRLGWQTPNLVQRPAVDRPGGQGWSEERITRSLQAVSQIDVVLGVGAAHVLARPNRSDGLGPLAS